MTEEQGLLVRSAMAPFVDASVRKAKKQARGKKEAKKQKTVTVSPTDPECGLFHKGEHKRCFAYEAHTACDKNGYVLEAVVTPGNVHDSVAFDDVYDKLIQSIPAVETVVADIHGGLTSKKSMPCIIPFTVVWPKSPTG